MCLMNMMRCQILHRRCNLDKKTNEILLKHVVRFQQATVILIYQNDTVLTSSWILVQHRRIQVDTLSTTINDDINVRLVRNDSNINIIWKNTNVYIQEKNRTLVINVENVLAIQVNRIDESMYVCNCCHRFIFSTYQSTQQILSTWSSRNWIWINSSFQDTINEQTKFFVVVFCCLSMIDLLFLSFLFLFIFPPIAHNSFSVDTIFQVIIPTNEQ